MQPPYLIDLPALDQVMQYSVLTVAPDTLVIDVIALMSELKGSGCILTNAETSSDLSLPSQGQNSCALVVQGSCLVGIFTEQDVVRLTVLGTDFSSVKISQVMQQQVITLTASDGQNALTALALMRQHQICHLPVVNEQNQLVGLITQDRIYQVIESLQQRLEDLSQINQQLQQELEKLVEQRTADAQINTDSQQKLDSCKQSEEQIAFQASLLNQVRNAVIATDLEGKVIYWNKFAEELYQLTLEDMGRSILEVTVPIKHQEIAQQIMVSIQATGAWEGEFEVQRRDGTIFPAHVVNTLVRDQAGQAFGIVGVSTDISEQQAALRDRKQAEKALRESEQRLQAILDNTAAVIYAKDFQGRYILVNSQYERLTHLTSEQVKGKTDYDIFPYEAAEVFWQNDRRIFTALTPIEFEEQVPLDDGLHTYLAIKFPLYDAHGKPYAICGISTDITERKKTTEALRQSEATLRSFFNSTSMMMGIVELIDEDIRIVTCNPATANFYGVTPEALQQILVSEMGIPEQYQSEWRNHYLEAQRTQAPVHFEHIQESPQGQRWFFATVCTISEHFGEHPRFAFVIEDITKRKQAEQKIAEQAALIDITTDAIFVRDLDSHILFWNRGAENLYGWTTEEILGKKAYDLFCKPASSQFKDFLKVVVEQGFWQGELEQITKTGKNIIVASRCTLVQDEAGQPQSLLVVNTDITEKKQLEKQFYRAQRLESVGTLASGIAHDLNNVFGPILMIAQLLPLRLRNADAKTQELLKTLEDSSKRGSALVKQILTFARGTEGKCLPLQPRHVLLEVAQVIKQTFPKSIEICTEISAKTLWLVKADPTQLHQVLMNLAVNARDAMPNGGILTISAENRFIDQTYARMHLEANEGRYVVITVSDTGTGIPPEILDRIFDPFFTTKEVGQGTGLGLSTVLGIIKNHSGFLQVLSEVDKGTQFQVYLPSAEETAIEATAEEEMLEGNGELILIVDDETIVQQITKLTLENYNYKTLSANNGIEAIALYAQQQNEISVVLMDLMMPTMDGLTTIRTLKRLNPQVKIIASSGLPTHSQQALLLGAKAFLLKPYTAQDLLHTLSELIVTTDR
ncbi:MAG: PAS domain S-box protein [Mojavia pulchra JT2-VF2]|jgi:PAS domain S-box-containing protein|uniref:histidine kinase n=1 Tax=Mojavia pulchra JT2-VF2 TaxID=287848 RepID=A0A951PWP1_9NOST|nr:PAS domain S-box protein [Mojavia pulchra JT2-VF2]